MKSDNESLESFMAQIEATLGEIPGERRREMLAETRDHLESMIAARRADGLDQNAAWESARRAFGEAQAIGSEVVKEWKRAPRYETEGEPLSKQKKWMQIAQVLLWIMPVYSIMLGVIPYLVSHHLAGIACLVLAPCTLLFQIQRYRKSGTAFTPATIAQLFFSSAVQLGLGSRIQFPERLYNSPTDTFFAVWIAPLSFAICTLILIWTLKEAKKTFPWRKTPLYATNPIAAEDDYKLGITKGLLMGTTMGCMSSLWMGWKFFGLLRGAETCVFLILFMLAFERWIIKRWV